jgi:hypothetical protein
LCVYIFSAAFLPIDLACYPGAAPDQNCKRSPDENHQIGRRPRHA